MANPAAPTDAAGVRMGFGIYDNSGADAVAWTRILDPAVVDDETTPSGSVAVGQQAVTSGGTTIDRTISAASTNATSVKAAAGQVYGWEVTNTNASARYLKLYNKASAPTVGSDTPVLTITLNAGSGATQSIPAGIEFDTGIAFALTTGLADSDTNAVSANEHIVHLFYK